jgi:hypothetical protein
MIRQIGSLMLGLLIVSASAAIAAPQVGVRGGWAHATGDIFAGSGDLGGDGIYGFVASMGFLPMVDLEFAYERYTTDFTFSSAAYEDTFFGGKGTYKDQAYLFTGKFHIPLPGFPLGLYGGAGGGLHKIDMDVTPSGGELDPSLDDYVNQLGEVQNEWEWHLVGGAQIKLGSLPLLAYAEYRYQDLSGSDTPSYSSIYAGLNLYLF